MTHLEHKLEELVSNLGPVLEPVAENTPTKKIIRNVMKKSQKVKMGFTTNALIRVLLVDN